MAAYQGIVDQYGRPIDKAILTTEVAGPTIAGVRSPLTGYPGDGLNPQRLASILKEADRGDPLRYLELAETIEERDLHYVGVLGTRKRSVSQLEITVEPASDSTEHEAHAEMVRAWLKRDELQDELFDIFDAIGKGYSFTEIMWDTSEGQWSPRSLEWRDPRWFRPARNNLTTPMLIGEGGQEEVLPPGKFIHAVMRAKSGLPVRSGLARVVAWAWMFKAFTNRDWAIFTQTYGQPVRIGKYGLGASEKEKDVLFRAVANIAGDCAAIIPQSMLIEFVESKAVTASVDLYLKRIDHLDQQVSKAVLGQTATTDAIAGGHAVGQEHRQVQEDIERADAKGGAAILNRDLIRPWIQLEFGGHQKQFPRVKIGRAEDTDVKLTVDSVARMIPFGLKAGQKQMRDIIGIGAPADDDELLIPQSKDPADPDQLPGQETRPAGKAKVALHAELPRQRDPVDRLVDDVDALAAPALGTMIDHIRALVDGAETLEDVRDGLLALTPGMDPSDLAAAMRLALALAELGGREAIADGR